MEPVVILSKREERDADYYLDELSKFQTLRGAAFSYKLLLQDLIEQIVLDIKHGRVEKLESYIPKLMSLHDTLFTISLTQDLIVAGHLKDKINMLISIVQFAIKPETNGE